MCNNLASYASDIEKDTGEIYESMVAMMKKYAVMDDRLCPSVQVEILQNIAQLNDFWGTKIGTLIDSIRGVHILMKVIDNGHTH